MRKRMAEYVGKLIFLIARQTQRRHESVCERELENGRAKKFGTFSLFPGFFSFFFDICSSEN
jgi:hypothetical protein